MDSLDQQLDDLWESNDAPVLDVDGCCLYKSGITAIEIEGDRIELVKWDQSRRPKREWTVAGQLREFIKALD